MKQLTVLSLTALLTAWTALRPSAGVTTAAASAAATAPMAALFAQRWVVKRDRLSRQHCLGLRAVTERDWLSRRHGFGWRQLAVGARSLRRHLWRVSRRLLRWRLWVPWRLLWRHRRCDPRLFGLGRDRSGRSRRCDDRCCEHVAVATSIDRRREWRRVSGALHTVYREGNQLTGAAVAGKG
jgi:hypothetical protein